jgi:uncharacterized protein YoxC
MLTVASQVPSTVPRDGLSIAADVSIVIVAAAVVVVVLALAFLLARTNRLLAQVGQHIAPVAERTRGIAENVEHVTRSLRDDVERVNESVQALTDRLKLASDRMEERIEDFNALMEVVQEEAEGVFIDTASTVRGVKAGARSLTEPPPDAEAVTEQPERLAIKNG